MWRLINQNSQAKTAISRGNAGYPVSSRHTWEEDRRPSAIVDYTFERFPSHHFLGARRTSLPCSILAQDHCKFCHRLGVSKTFICFILIFKKFKYKKEIVAHIDRHRVSFIVLVKGMLLQLLGTSFVLLSRIELYEPKPKNNISGIH